MNKHDETVRGEVARKGKRSATLGEKVRKRRKHLGLTLKEVADAAGLSTGFISQIEKGISSPSLVSLASLSTALDTPIGFFVQQPDGKVTHTQRGARAHFQTGNRAAGLHLDYERISADLPNGRIRATIVHEPPGHRTEQMSHFGEEIYFILNGALVVEVEDEVYELKEGDSVHFESTRRHLSWNRSSHVCSYLHVFTMDVFDSD